MAESGDTPGKEGSRWASSWEKSDSDRRDGADHKSSRKDTATADKRNPPKVRGYQESRRYDRERRGKRNERKPDDKSTNDAAEDKGDSSEQQTTTPQKYKDDDNTKPARAQKTHERGSRGTPPAKSDHKTGKGDYYRDRGARKSDHPGGTRDSHRQQSGDKFTSKETTPSKEGRKTTETRADSPNLLNQPKEEKSRDHHSKTPSGKVKPSKTGPQSKGKSASDLESKWQKEEEQRRKKEEEQRRKEEAQRKKEEELRKKEEEQKRLEEEKIRQEEERKRREEEEAIRLKEEEMKSIQDFIEESREKNDWKNKMREINSKASENRPDEAFFGKLDSNLKKNTAFVKKMRNITESQKDALSKEFQSLNLTKYIGEVAAAITEAKLKMSDINCALHLCSLLHQRYVDFAASFMENWNKVLLSKKDDKIVNFSKLRVDLRFFADLVSIGVFARKEGLSMLANQLTLLISNDLEDHNNLSILLSFCKHCGDDYAGLLPRRYRLLAEKYDQPEIPRSSLLPAERQKACRNLLGQYFTSLCKHLEKDHKELKHVEKHNRKILQTKGELSTERKEKQDSQNQAFQKLLSNAQTFADLMDEDLPELPEDEYQPEAEMGIDIYHPMREDEYSGESLLFEDEDTRQFYENIPDLKAIIPKILYKDSENAAPTTEQTSDADLAVEDFQELDVEELEKVLTMEMEQHVESQTEEVNVIEGSPEHDGKVEDEPEVEEEDNDIAGSLKLVLETFLNSLPTCVNRELIDRAATDFCMNMNTKANRKKLVRALFSVHRTRYDLLPFYARLVATLHPCMPDVAADLGTLLKGDFKWHVRKKDQINIESKLKTVRFIGELTKFNMFPKPEALHCLKMLMFDFSHHNIEMACSLLETSGRFLYRSPDSHQRTKVYLEMMMRKKAAFAYDQRYATMIENAFYYSNPPENKQEARKERPPMHQYIRRLLYKDLSKITTEKVLRQMRKLDWENTDVRNYVTKCIKGIWNVRYNSIHCCANLLAGLASYHEEVAIDVVDGTLEDIRLGMEINIPKYNQRRVSCVKFLGELYNYRMVESGVIFKTLYSFITFGVSLDESVPSPLDPPEHLFRIRLTCVLLDTCGQYFDRGSSKRKLDYFLNYFLRYYWFKRKCQAALELPFPMDIEYTLRDTTDCIRPKYKLPESYEEAVINVQQMEQELLPKIADVLPKFHLTDETADEESDTAGGLSTIQESEEIDDMSQGLSQIVLTGDGTPDSDGERDERTGSQSQTHQQHHHADDCGEEGGEEKEEGDGEDDSDDLLESAGEEEADDQVTVLTGGPKHIACQEDEDFMATFDKMLSETIQARTQETVKAPQVEITVPVHLKLQKKPKAPVMTFPGMARPDKEEEEEEEELEDKMKFTLITKKGNKPKFATLNIPVSESFASKFREREEELKAEKEKMKRVVLDFHERQEEEDYQEMIASLNRPAMVNLNRDKKVRYQHPKGAPDADMIFGSKKR